MLPKLLLSEDHEETSRSENPKGVYSKSRIKARTKQNLWNVKQERPELFVAEEKPKERNINDLTIEVPIGFEKSAQEGWFLNPNRHVFFEAATGRQVWFDASTNSYLDLHQGLSLPLSCIAGAARSLGSSAMPKGSPTVSSGGSSSSKQLVPRQVIIPDLHRTAQVLKMDIDHLDQPSAFMAVFGAASGDRVAPTEAAAPKLHEKLIRRLAASRSQWTEDALCKAVMGALEDITLEHGVAQPLVAIALVVGDCIVSVASPGTSAHLLSTALANTVEATPNETVESASSVKLDCHKLGASRSELCIALCSGEINLEDSKINQAAIPILSLGRPRAASTAILRAARSKDKTLSAVVACLRLSLTMESFPSSTGPAIKRQRMDETLVKIRVRQILLRYWKGTGPEPIDPIRRKAVSRTSEEAEEHMLQIVESLGQNGCAGFSSLCKAHSECESALKGGELAGDLGWLDREKGKDTQQANARTVKAVIPALVLKAAFEMEVGQLSDLVSSDIGIHLLLRTA